jgi:hypothetical protein
MKAGFTPNLSGKKNGVFPRILFFFHFSIENQSCYVKFYLVFEKFLKKTTNFGLTFSTKLAILLLECRTLWKRTERGGLAC